MDINRSQDAILKGASRYERWLKKAQFRFEQPRIDVEIARQIKAMPPEIRAQLEQLAPDALRDVEQKFGGGQ